MGGVMGGGTRDRGVGVGLGRGWEAGNAQGQPGR